MTLKGKCKEAFEKWFLDNYGFDKWEDVIPNFHNIDPSMKYGVIVDFSETVEDVTNHKMVEAEQSYINGGHSRPESRIMTVKKFDKRYNQNK
jgi:hypothetical protein